MDRDGPAIRCAERSDYALVRSFLSESAERYPTILKWWQKRVVPGLHAGERLCHVAFLGDQLAGLSIGKRRKNGSAKLCSLRVREACRGEGIGEALLRSTLRDLRSHGCCAVHFTVSEPVLNECGHLFQRYGFSMNSWATGRYTDGIDELVFSADAISLDQQLRRRTRHVGKAEAVLLAIKPEYADLIQDGLKTVEFRRQFSAISFPKTAFFYVTAPVREIRLTATITQDVKASPETLWAKYGARAATSQREFSSYFAGAQQGHALLLSNVGAFTNPLQPSRPTKPPFKPPQSYTLLTGAHPLVGFLGTSQTGGIPCQPVS